MATKFDQQQITYKNLKGEEQVIGTFWIDENGKVDSENLPSKEEIAQLLWALSYNKNVQVESTGFVVND